MNLFTRKAASVAALTVLGLTAGGIAWAESTSAPVRSAAAGSADAAGLSDAAGPSDAAGLNDAAGLSDAGAGDAATPDAGRKGRARGLGGRMLHGEFVMQTRNGFVTAVLARGTVSAIDANSISVKSPDGVTTTFAIDAKTKARSAGSVVPLTSVHEGDKVGVLGVKNGSAVVAKVIRKLPASTNNT